VTSPRRISAALGNRYVSFDWPAAIHASTNLTDWTRWVARGELASHGVEDIGERLAFFVEPAL
jgi:hypothetical protein